MMLIESDVSLSDEDFLWISWLCMRASRLTSKSVRMTLNELPIHLFLDSILLIFCIALLLYIFAPTMIYQHRTYGNAFEYLGYFKIICIQSNSLHSVYVLTRAFILLDKVFFIFLRCLQSSIKRFFKFFTFQRYKDVHSILLNLLALEFSENDMYFTCVLIQIFF